MTKFLSAEEFLGERSYSLLPFRFRRLSSSAGQVLVTNDLGEYLLLDSNTFEAFAEKQLPIDAPAFWDLESRHFLSRSGVPIPMEAMATQYRSRKAFVFDGPALHIFVVTLRCNHTCNYCQVSRRVETDEVSAFDMSREDAQYAIGHVLNAPAQHVTIEFQGGEPLLAFDLIRFVVESVNEQAPAYGKSVRYVITTVLQHLDAERLDFIRKHKIELSTSVDGPAHLHNHNRPLPGRDSFEKTMAGVTAARTILGEDAVAALTTITRKSLEAPEAIIDTYRAMGFRSIFLRPLSPYGFAARSSRRDYSTAEFLAFYKRAVDHLIQVNLSGYAMDEAYAALLLRNILTPFSNGHVDLRSPAGAGFGVWVYNYDGRVYASDESRMLAEMGDDTFCLGPVNASYEDLLSSPAMRLIASASVAESIPGCTDCAYLPYCGLDPIDSYRRQGDVIGHRPTSDFCERQMGIFDFLFEKLQRGDPDEMSVLISWINRRERRRPGDSNGIAARL